MKLGCCNKLMDMVRAAYDMATHAIKGVQLGSDPEIKYPDGAGIVKLNVPDAQTLDEIEAYIEVSKATDERLNLDIERLNTAKQDKLIAGANITISDDNVISATGGGGGGSDSDFTAQNNDGSIMFFKNGVKQAELTEGANITISADGVISATGGGTGGTPTADEVLLTDGRSVQDGIDSIEDELGDLGTSGTVQSRLEALEASDASQDASIAEYDLRLGSLSQAVGSCIDDFTIDKSTVGKIGITMDKIDGMTSQSADIITAGDGVSIENGVISARADTTALLNPSIADIFDALTVGESLLGNSFRFLQSASSGENIKLTNFSLRCVATFANVGYTTKLCVGLAQSFEDTITTDSYADSCWLTCNIIKYDESDSSKNTIRIVGYGLKTGPAISTFNAQVLDSYTPLFTNVYIKK